MRNSRKKIQEQGLIFVCSVKNNFLYAKKTRKALRDAGVSYEKIATTDWQYDIFCENKDAEKIINILV